MKTTSLNDLDAQLAALEGDSGSDYENASESEPSCASSASSDIVWSSDEEAGAAPSPPKKPRRDSADEKAKAEEKKSKREAKLARKNAKNNGAKLADAEKSSPSSPKSSTKDKNASSISGKQDQQCKQVPDIEEEEKRRQDAKRRIRQHAQKGFSKVCFRFVRDGQCKFDDCLFEHKAMRHFSEEDLVRFRKELEYKPFEQKIADQLRELNIPSCKDYNRTGDCKKGAKCNFWHISNAHVARWAGFPYYCELCWKPITSKDAWDEHVASKKHLQNARQWGGATTSSWQPSSSSSTSTWCREIQDENDARKNEKSKPSATAGQSDASKSTTLFSLNRDDTGKASAAEVHAISESGAEQHRARKKKRPAEEDKAASSAASVASISEAKSTNHDTVETKKKPKKRKARPDMA
ncbi:unnamed protein product [Amoebophrya sp. A25]|nr:unnamed protein product [Amoebophrya sp. A25]|eukprot:GSA25T00000866001.1